MFTITATQTWCLARVLPLLVGDLVPEGHEHWENFLQLVTIMDYVFGHVTSPSLADYLGVLIEDFLIEFRRLYPERQLTPKMHYIIHLPSWIKRFTALFYAINYCVHACMAVTTDGVLLFVCGA